jgi:Dimerisation and cyclophilin-binding domain of Mon2
MSSPKEIAQNEDILRIFLMTCDVKSVKLNVIGLSCLQKLIAHDAVAPSALKDILLTLKDVSPSVTRSFFLTMLCLSIYFTNISY